MSYTAECQSHTQKAKPARMHAFISSQYQRAKRAPANSDMATVMSTEKATTPMNVLGKPNVCACQDCMTCPHETHGFRSQLVRWVGSAARMERSMMMTTVAAIAMSDVTSSIHAVPRVRAYQGRSRSRSRSRSA